MVGAKYLLGLALFILHTSWPLHLLSVHRKEMIEALDLLESALRIGTEHQVLSEYMARRLNMQIQGGHYNLHEPEYLAKPSVLEDIQNRIRATGAIANLWKLHEMVKWDLTPLHNGVVFCCTLGLPEDIEMGRKFLRELIKLDKAFANRSYCRDGLSPLGSDSLVKHHANKLYVGESE